MATNTEYHLFTGAIKHSGTKKPETESSNLDSTVNAVVKPIIESKLESKNSLDLTTKSVTDISTSRWTEKSKLCARALGALFLILCFAAIFCIFHFAAPLSLFVLVLFLMPSPLAVELDIWNKEAHPDNSQTPNAMPRSEEVHPPKDFSEIDTSESGDKSNVESSSEEILGKKDKSEFREFFDTRKVTHSENSPTEEGPNVIPVCSQAQPIWSQKLFWDDVDFVVSKRQHSPNWTKQENWRERAYYDRIERPYIDSLISDSIK